MNDFDRKPEHDELMIVGIGASAGGIKALKEFFRNTDQATDIAYVVIVHMSPEHESNLGPVLQGATGMHVSRVECRSELKANCVYVISPNQSLSIAGNDLIVSEIHSIEERRAPVDVFFRTLASAKGPSSVAVILSGTGANGSSGLKRIKEFGGCVFVQDPGEAEFSDMPRNAIATGYVDQVLSVCDMPGKIAIYRELLREIELPSQDGDRPEDHERALREVIIQLRRHTGYDFSNYKNSTVVRRIARRMGIHEMVNLLDYAHYVREHADEARALLRDLLISVTNFFRDKEAFEAFATNVVPRLFQDKEPDDTIRVWVAGCATGEEAYSVAMLLAEAMPEPARAPMVQIFATDIDRDAIIHARDGFYTDTACADISPERLQRFFQKEIDGYRIRKELRERMLFVVHDAVKDPPFSRLDLVCCRNLLIYLNRPGQQRVLNTLHFALRPGGFLFSGSSENPDSVGDSFVVFDKEHRIYRARALQFRPSADLPGLLSSAQRIERMPPVQFTERRKQKRSFADLHLRLLEQYAPPSVVVNEDYHIVHMTESAARYMRLPGGEPSHNLLKVIVPELRIELRSALYQAMQKRTFVEAHNVKLDSAHAVNLIVRPVLRDGDTARGFVLVLFKESRADDTAENVVLAGPIAGQLEDELIRLKAQLRDNLEQHELQNEELRASNEELQAANEELQSATEEMETSREELQSVNEELTTVNQELKVKIDELSHANNDLQNLINSTDIGTIFLDSSLMIKFFTPRARDVFNLIPADRGRPLADITTKLDYDEKLLDEVTRVLDNLQPLEREVRTREGRWHLMRLLPYRTQEDRIDGVVATFLDITQRKESEKALRKSEERFRAIVAQAAAGVAETDLEGNFTFVNRRYCDITGYPESELLRMKIQDIIHPDDNGGRHMLERMAGQPPPLDIEKRYVRKDGSFVWVSNNVTVVTDREGRPHSELAVTLDITERKLAQDVLSESEKFRRAIEIETVGVIFFKVDGAITYCNDAFLTMSGYSREDAKAGLLRWDTMTPAEWMPRSLQAVEEFVKIGQTSPYEKEYIRKDGSRWWALFAATRLNEEEGVEYVIDISERKQAEQALRESEERYRTLFESIDEGFCLCEVMFDENGKPVDYLFLEANPVFEKLTRLKNVVGRTARQLVPQLEQWRFETYGKVALTQEASRFEHFSETMNHWFDVYASSVGGSGSRKIAIVFTDITQRKLAEQALRKATEELAAANTRLEQQVALRTALIEQRSRQLRSLAVQLTQAEALERKRIAQVLHDHLQQVIIAAKYKLQAQAGSRKDYKPVFELLDEGVRSARSLAGEISPPALYHSNFIAALDWLAWFAKEQYGLKVTVSSNAGEILLSDEQKVMLYQAARELLLNIFKHTKVKQAKLRWGACSRYTILRVEDKGAGFDPMQASNKTDAGFGLFAIRERLEALGGGLIIRSRPRRGTRIAMVLPRLRKTTSTRAKAVPALKKTAPRPKSS